MHKQQQVCQLTAGAPAADRGSRSKASHIKVRALCAATAPDANVAAAAAGQPAGQPARQAQPAAAALWRCCLKGARCPRAVCLAGPQLRGRRRGSHRSSCASRRHCSTTSGASSGTVACMLARL
jgi:hypothetical protein